MNNRFTSIRDFLRQNQPANTDTVQHFYLNLVEDEAETIYHHQLTPQEMSVLRRTDPFSYYSILMAQQGTRYCDFENLRQGQQAAGVPGDGGNAAGGVQIMNNDISSRRSSIHESVPSRPPISIASRGLHVVSLRRSSMPNLEAESIDHNHRLPTLTVVKRRRRFATEMDAVSAVMSVF